MKKILLLMLTIAVTGAGCPLIKSKAPVVSLAPQAPHMEQTTSTEPNLLPPTSTVSLGQGDVPNSPNDLPVFFGETDMTLVSDTHSEKASGLSGLPFTLSFNEHKQVWKTPDTRVNVRIPVMTNLKDPEAALAYNDILFAKADGEVQEFLKSVIAWDQDITQDPGAEYSLDLVVNLELVTPKLIAAVFVIDTYFAPAAHPNRKTFSFNYDVERGEELDLTDLFALGKKFLPTLSREAIAAIKVHRANDDLKRTAQWLETGAGSKAENFHTVTPTRAGFKVEFDPYDIDAYIAGPTVIVLPYSHFDSLMSPRIFDLVK